MSVKFIDHSPCGLGVVGWGAPLMCKSCELVGVSPCGLGVGGPFSV